MPARDARRRSRRWRRLGLPAVESLGVARDGTFAERIAAPRRDFETVARAADDLAAILYTSGTTGRSKGAMLTHENLASNALTLVDALAFHAADVLIHALPVFHTHGLFVATNVALLTGATMIFQPRFDADAIVAALPRATTLMGVPTFYVRLLEHPGLTREACAHMRLFVSGSAPLLAETHERWREKTGHAILERYGMTETNMITSNPYDGERRAGHGRLSAAGRQFAHRRPGNRRAASGRAGSASSRSRARTSSRAIGGCRKRRRRSSARDGFFITGDLGRIDDDGYLHIVGRAKDLIISGGFNVYPKEVETEIDALDGVAESAVIGVPHPDFGEGVTAVVVAAAGAELDEAAMLAALGRPPRQIQDAEARLCRRGLAAQRDGQGAESRLARDLQGPLSRLTGAAGDHCPRRRSDERNRSLLRTPALYSQ